jgi:SPP1 family predicted phage head-tail adaptor
MKAGDLRHLIRIDEPVRTEEEGGGSVDRWTPFADGVWAAVVPLSGSERVAAMQSAATVSHRVELRYLPGLGEGMRVVHETRAFNIRAVLDIDERHREIHLLCDELR